MWRFTWYLAFLFSSCNDRPQYAFYKSDDIIVLEVNKKMRDTFLLKDYIHYKLDTLGVYAYSTKSNDDDCKIYEMILNDEQYKNRIKKSLDIEIVNKFYGKYYDKGFGEIIKDSLEIIKVHDLIRFSQFYFNDNRINNYIELYSSSYVFWFFTKKDCPEDKSVGSFWEEVVGYCKEVELANSLSTLQFFDNGSWVFFYQKHPNNFGDDVGFLFTPFELDGKFQLEKHLLNPTSYIGKSFSRAANDYPQSRRNKDTTHADVQRIDTLIFY